MNETLDELMRKPATEFDGPYDPRLQKIIAYMQRYMRQGRRARRSEFADPRIDPSAPLRAPSHKRAYRRF